MKPQVHSTRVRIALLSIVGVLGALAINTAVAYWATGWLFGFVPRPPEVVVQILNTIVGFLLFGVVAGLVSWRAAPRRRRWFETLIDAFNRMAKGDFSVRLEALPDVDGGVGDLYRSVNQMAIELDQLEQMRQEFVSNVSHEIQSPLTSIRGFARALRDEERPETRDHYLSIIEQESMRLSELSDNLLELASLDSGQRALDRKPFRLDQQISHLILAAEPQWTEKRLELDADLGEIEVVADEGLLAQVWQNLLHNAIKFTPAGGCLRVIARRVGDRVEVEVADTGPGIAAEDLPHLFERFFKADRARQRTGGGSGLGLAIAHKIVSLHGGTIAVQSASGQGTTFTVSVPAV